ncbi:MAG: HU family DNA-binding protein [Akkermansia sp.]|nr:integration host factor subunit beta [Akkermansia sp.]MDO4752289.1 HU family DNA-binding protein [Akkermansia sp.]
MANTITKRELVNKICAEMDSDLTQNDVLEVIQKAVDLITEALGNGDRVVLRNFGTFTVKEVKAKIGRNPKNPGKDVPIPARSVVKFKVGKTLKEAAAKVVTK